MIADLRLQHFRSYDDQLFELGSGVNIVVGPNASGKTNLLEAILVLARGNSYRVTDNELVQFESEWARLDANLISGSARTVKFIPHQKPAKTYELAGKAYQRLTLQHSLPVVLFEPNHLRLLTGSPESRRNYLDDILEQTQPQYGAMLRHYRRALAQRNALLKTGRSKDQFFVWNIRLSELGGHIVAARTKLIETICQTVEQLYRDISRTTTGIEISYDTKLNLTNYESQLLHNLEAGLEKDMLRGFTSVGPHREDLQVLFNGHPASMAASRGEARTLVLALKIIELQLLEQARGATPLLLLDDVFSELDGARRRALTEHLTRYQTFITTTDADVVIQHFTESCHIIPLGG
jgi:DNA replication and repair protein RecF